MWASNLNLEQDFDTNPEWWFIRAVWQRVCRKEGTIHKKTVSGYITEGKSNNIATLIEEAGAHPVFQIAQKMDEYDRAVYVWDDGLVILQKSYGAGHSVEMYSLDKSKVDGLSGSLKKIIRKEQPKGQVKMLVSGGNGVNLHDIGQVKQPLERKNYTDQVLKYYDFVCDELRSKTPTGRMVLLDGEPGTGKSYFIRGLVDDVNGWFVYVPAGMTGSLTGPNLVAALADENRKNEPLILILEDADASLMNRERGSPNQLAELLNMSDGIFGELADIRIIASTNARRSDWDAAIMRPGRLSAQVHFAKLEFDKSKEIYKRLTDRDFNGKEDKYTLAEIYRMAREDGWKPPKVTDSGYGQFL